MSNKKNLDHFGIPCPSCGGRNRRVVDSRPMQSYIYRRSVCDNCGGRFTTYEAIEGFVDVLFSSKLLEKINELEDSLASLRKIIEKPLDKINERLS